MPCCNCRFHSVYIGVLTVLVLLTFGGPTPGGAIAKRSASVPPLANTLVNAVLVWAMVVKILPGTLGARAPTGVPGPMPPRTVKLLKPGGLIARLSETCP